MTTTTPDLATTDPTPAPLTPWRVGIHLILPWAVYLTLLSGATAGVTRVAVALGAPDDGSPAFKTAILYIMATCLCLLVTAAVWLMSRYVARIPFSTLHMAPNRRAAIGLACGLGLALVAVASSGFALNALGVGVDPSDKLMSDAPVWVAVAFGIGLAVLLQGIPEEIMFRGYVLAVFAGRPWFTVLFSGITFGTVHLTSQGGQETAVDHLIYLVGPTGFGLAAAALALVTKSMWAGVGVHAGAHLTNIFVVMPLVSHWSQLWGYVPAGVMFAAAAWVVMVHRERLSAWVDARVA